MPSEWYESFFSPLALQFWRAVIPPEATRDEVDFVERALGLPRPGAPLDLPCGGGEGGRARRLAARARARGGAPRAGLSAEFRAGDMRSPPPGPFDGVCCLGNSISYLSHEDLRAFLRGVHAAVRPGARWVVDSGTAAESLLPKL